MFKRSVFAAIMLLATLSVAGQNKLVRFEELRALQTTAAKPIVVLIMTDWCKYCHAMQNTMLKNSRVSALLKNSFHTVFLDAEEKKDILFAGRTFKYKSGINELARQLATKAGKLSYPTLCILDANNEIIYQHDGYLSPQAMLYTLNKITEKK
ncbi:thioredoxin family protein [Daejeonella sp.]|uniref:thioredoxin family protein n=1 Tax=Daejeonella sp. TaxID=2805397 RepID=UPI0030C44F77